MTLSDVVLRVVGDALCDQTGECTCASREGHHQPGCGWLPIATLDAVYAALAEATPGSLEFAGPPVDPHAPVDWKATAVDLRRQVVIAQKLLQRAEKELLRHTDDTCYGRCDSPEGLSLWFQHETRGLLDGEVAHEVLDMLLNKLNPTTT